MVLAWNDFFDKAKAADSSEPTRLQIVDALRGFSLLGILIVHCSRWFSAHDLPKPIHQLFTTASFDKLASQTIEILFVNKFYSLFSFLFGIGFTFIIRRWQKNSVGFYWFFARRMIVLGLIGLCHYIHWRGDILVVYAILGFFLPFFNRLPNQFVLVIALLLVLNVPVKLAELSRSRFPSLNQPSQQTSDYLALQKAYVNIQTLSSGSYKDTVVANANAVEDAIDFQFGTGRIFKTLGFFLLGMYAGRRHLFNRLQDKPALLRTLVIYAVLTLPLIKVIIVLLTQGRNYDQQTTLHKIGLMGIYDLRDLTLTFLYVFSLTLFYQYRFGRWALNPLASVGRMALSNYLLQTVIGTFLFFGYGAGLLGLISFRNAILLSIPIFLGQVVFSHYWLTFFRYGPVEWIWRSITYGRLQPMRVAVK